MARIVALWIVLLSVTTARVTWGLVSEAKEDNCILSFVVPRDKMKSSCELDEKVMRRLNSMEIKVNLYKQEVADLQLLLEKERQLNAEKLDRLEQEFHSRSSEDEINMLVNNRLDNLEKSLDQIQPDLTSIAKLRHVNGASDKSGLPFNTIDTNADATPAFIKSLVQSEMKTAVENLTKKLESYVQEQVVLYNQLFRMYPKRTDNQNSQTTQPSVNLKDKPKTIAPERTLPMLNDKGMRADFEKILSKVDDTGDQIAKHVGIYIKNMTVPHAHSPATESPIDEGPATESPNGESPAKEIPVAGSPVPESTIEPNTTANFTGISLTNEPEIVLKDDLSEANDSFSGANNTVLNDTKETEVHAPVNKDITAARIGTQQSDADKSNTTATDAAHTEHPEPTEHVSKFRNDSEEEKNWTENMIRDQIDKQKEMEEKLRGEITAMLYSPLAEVLSIVEKKATALEEKLKVQDDKTQQATKDINSRVRELDQNLKAATLQMESLSEGFKDVFAKLDKIKPLEILINEIKKNVTSTSLTRSTLELDEQNKKLNKMQRLMEIYQHTFDHFKNETKVEYREIRQIFEKEFNNLRTSSKTLQENLTTVVSSAVGKLNDTLRSKIKDINQQIDEKMTLVQVDLDRLERKLNNKNRTKIEREEEMQRTVHELANKQRDFKKMVDHLEQQTAALGGDINATAKQVLDLKTEVKLNVLEEWLKLSFEYDASRTDCHGDQYVKKLNYKNVRLVGVVLCSPTRYKILLSNSLNSKFLNVGDNIGLGEDHCEFVGARNHSTIKLSPARGAYFSQGFARSNWGQEPTLGSLNAIKPSPDWYECGVTIP
ncbi:unnamed protein product [Lymnaea stagnalis]|uniref:Target of Nesh-SH3/FNDC1 C-terminal domain-containing protein n=1 Tax=Lymnaea stagnalis TaxID=6523 RepID=A0AAV2I1L1_LYMST